MIEKVDGVGPRLNVFANPELDYQFARVLTTQISGGAALGECLATARRLTDGSHVTWTQAWTETAARAQNQAETSLAQAHIVSAREEFLRAANYYRVAGQYTHPGGPLYHGTWHRSRTCFRLAGALTEPAFVALDIPYENLTLPGYFLPGWGNEPKRPTVIMMSGFDGTAEELYFQAGWAAPRRGYNAVIFDGPGQGGALHLRGLPFRPDYEVPVRAVIDYTLSLPYVDGDRLALLGFNWGGHFALRAAAYDRRIRAAIADSPIINLFDHMMGMNPSEMQQLLAVPPKDLHPEVRTRIEAVIRNSPTLRWHEAVLARRLGTRSLLEAFHALRAYDVHGLEDYITCPMLLLVSESEGSEAVAQARRMRDTIAGPTSLHVFSSDEAAAHCQLDNLSALSRVVFDWLDLVFTAPAAAAA